MFDDLRDLYQEIILDHSRHPRNLRRPPEANREAMGHNPLCGDALVVYLTVDPDGLIRDCAFKGKGCAISTASASLMTEMLLGKTMPQAERLFHAFHAMATGAGEGREADGQDAAAANGIDEDDLDRLRALAGVRQFPIRVKCATLAWHTMQAALSGQPSASTE